MKCLVKLLLKKGGSVFKHTIHISRAGADLCMHSVSLLSVTRGCNPLFIKNRS